MLGLDHFSQVLTEFPILFTLFHALFPHAPLRLLLWRTFFVEQILSNLAQSDGVDWSKTKIYFADERCVPLDHDDRYACIATSTCDTAPLYNNTGGNSSGCTFRSRERRLGVQETETEI